VEPGRRSTGFSLTLAALVFAPASAIAQSMPPPGLPGPLPVDFGADEVGLDARSQALEARGHVHVDEPPFHLESEELTLKRVRFGVELDGQGRLSFCPCLGTPLAIRFDGATLSPPHDVVLRDPVLEVFGVPVAWAPVFWLRSPGRFGLLAPDLEWRGADGFFAGGGVHMPWQTGDLTRGIDLRAGGYVDGGVVVETTLRTVTTTTRIRWDRWRGDDGLTLDARGATAIAGEERIDSVSWEVGGLRGARAVKATTDVDAAARPFDRAEAQAAWLPAGFTFASGVRTVALRGGDLTDLGSGGPVVVARRADALGHAGAYDVGLEGGQVAGAGLEAISFARAEGGALLATRMGAAGASLALRGLGDVANNGSGGGYDGAGQARATISLPLSRGYASPDTGDPWVHTTEPRVEVAGGAVHASDILVLPVGRGAGAPSGGTWVFAAAWHNAVARWGSRAAAEVDLLGGVVGNAGGVFPAVRARAAAGGDWLGLRVDFARVAVGSTFDAGGAFVAAARVGPGSGLHLAAHVAERDGIDPMVARALVDAPLEPASGFLAAPGWTGGARLAVPLGRRITTRGGADVDFDQRQLVAAVGSLELHDPCNCVVVRATASHRIGRGGVDAWLAVDLPLPGR
jgi:hypothetical protein